jgi:hypothetical protein
MNATVIVWAASILAMALLAASTAQAQPDYSFEDKLACRVTYLFASCKRTLDKTPADALGIAGTVVGSKRLSSWRTRLEVEVMRATATLGKSVEVDVAACFAWVGKIGDQIAVIVHAQPDAHHGAYQLHASCNT